MRMSTLAILIAMSSLGLIARSSQPEPPGLDQPGQLTTLERFCAEPDQSILASTLFPAPQPMTGCTATLTCSYSGQEISCSGTQQCSVGPGQYVKCDGVVTYCPCHFGPPEGCPDPNAYCTCVDASHNPRQCSCSACDICF
jgi:hypothetical protein